jgi:cellulose synthase/poly-beta-1,6-N-acetylglucosamine synthase-like glycosyltransferase
VRFSSLPPKTSGGSLTTEIWGTVLGVAVVAAGPFSSSAAFVQWIESIPFPLGAIPVGLVIGYAIHRCLRRFRRWAVEGRPAVPLPPVAPTSPPGPRIVDAPWSEDALSEGEVPAAAVPVTPTTEPAPAVRPPITAVLWDLEHGERVLPGTWAPPSVATRPPATSGFAARLVAIFLVAVVVLGILAHYIFLGFDLIARTIGTLVYWPLPWPGLVVNPTLRRVLPDFVIIVYLGLMLAFVLATGLLTNPRFTDRQRRAARDIVVAYLVAEVLIDTVAFVFPERLLASGFLLLRGFVGGLFFALLLFSTLVMPPPTEVQRRFSRDRSASIAFFGTAAVAVAISVALLALLYHSLGFGRDLIPFAVMLLVPLVSLTLWGFFGRLLYESQLARHPRPPLGEFHPAVTILIPAFNEVTDIARCIASADAAADLYPGPVEIIVVNDGSTDRTSEVARAAVSTLKFARGAVLDLPHGGKSNALNGGLAVAQGVIIVRIDADSRISSLRGFGAMVGHLADPEVGGVQGLILPLQMNGWTGKLRLMEIAWNHLFLRRATMATRATQVVDGAFCAFRKKDLVEAGGWVAWNGEDTELTLRLQRAGYRMRFEEGAAAFEDVPSDYVGLRKQRIRWTRGGIFAHRRHFGAIFAPAIELGGLALVLWFAFFSRNGLRGLVWVYAALVTVLIGLPTLLTVAIITAVLLVPRGIVLGYYMSRFGRWRDLPYVMVWPITGIIKQFIALESLGSMLPGAAAEFAE